MMKSFLNWRQLIPTLFTLAAMLCGLLSILYIVQGFHGEDPAHWYRMSAKMIMLAMILDGLDGNVARWLKGSSEFGAELDTYVDMTAFGIAPAVLIFAVTMETQDAFLRILLPSVVVLSGVVRLARFKVTDPLRGQGGYAGLPITTNAAWVAMLVYISQVPASVLATKRLVCHALPDWYYRIHQSTGFQRTFSEADQENGPVYSVRYSSGPVCLSREGQCRLCCCVNAGVGIALRCVGPAVC